MSTAAAEGGRRSSRLAAKRKEDETKKEAHPQHEEEEGEEMEEEEEEEVEEPKRGRKRARGGGAAARGGRGRGKGRGGRKKKEEEEEEEGEGGEAPAKKPRRAPRGKRTAPQEEGKEKEEEEGKEKEKEEEGEEEEEEEEEMDVDTQGGGLTDEEAERKARGIRFLEKGHIYFFYRPRVEADEATSYQDVQRLYILLSTKRTPESPHEERSHRLLMIPKKMMPSIGHKARHWAVVTKVTHHVKDVHSFLETEHYQTATLGERTVAAARPAAEGYYCILEHNGHTHLVYILEQPQELGEVQQAFHLHPEGSYIITVKNPDTPSRAGVPHAEGKPDYPDDLKNVFRGRRWAPVNPPTFLNYEHAEFVIVGVADDLVDEFGKSGQQLEQEEKKDVQHGGGNLFKELRISKEEFPPEPLFQGTWA